MLAADCSVRRGSFTLRCRFEVAQGSVLGVVGPSGAGKTTLLDAVAGLVDLDEGWIRVGETVVSSPGARVALERRSVGLVPQRTALFRHLDVVGNVGFSRHASADDVEALLRRFGLAAVRNRSVATLSGGQARRVAIARALAAHPKVLAFDEPMAGLDHELVDDVADAIREGATQCAVVVVDHDLASVARVADALLVLDDGTQLQLGSASAVQRRPASGRVARLLGMVGPFIGEWGEAWAWPSALQLVDDLGGALGSPARILEPARVVGGRLEQLVIVDGVGSVRAETAWDRPLGRGWLALEDAVVFDVKVRT